MKHVISVLCVLAVLLCMAPFVSPNGEGEAVSAAARTETGPFIVDAGHGGEDGGAVSADGTQESGINLAIALRLEDILAFCGAAPVMLRREDISLHDPEAGSLKEKKSSDLRNRTRAVQDLSGAHPDQCPPKQLPGEPLRRCTGVLRTHRGLPGTGRIHPRRSCAKRWTRTTAAGQADPRHSISDESH